MCVATIVQPVTGYHTKLYESLNPTTVISALGKGFLSSLRMDDINDARKKITQIASNIYTAALAQYKSPSSIPETILTIIMAILAMLKSIHSQPEAINNTLLMDRVLSERLFLQSAGLEINNVFNPYLFDLSNLESGMCGKEG